MDHQTLGLLTLHLTLVPLKLGYALGLFSWWNHRPATVCVAENGQRSRVGVRQPPPQFDVEDIRDGKEVELFSGEQSCHRSISPRENSGPRKARASGNSDRASLVTAERARPYDGAPGHIDRNANRRNPGIATEGYKFLFRSDQNRTSVLSRFAPQRPKAADVLFPCQQDS